jgi:hypothetical protein
MLLFVSCQPALAENRGGDPASLDVGAVQVDDDQFRVTIADPFIELHTGPSAGYPIFHVVERGSEVRVIRRKTSWFKLETDDGKVGWASREQMRQTLLPSGEKFRLVEQGVEDFSQRKWVLGITGGEFEKSPVFTFFTGYAFTENLAGELHIGQSVGSRSSSAFYKGNLVMQPLPEFRFSPYLTLGMGRIEVTPSTTLVAANAETNTFAQFGLGLQTYISRSFLLRFEVNEYVVFSTTSTSNNNEEVEEWKFGFAVFF